MNGCFDWCYPDRASRELDFPIDENGARCRARTRYVSILPIDRSITNPEADIGAGSRGDVNLAGARRLLKCIVAVSQFRKILLEDGASIQGSLPIAIGGNRARSRADRIGAVLHGICTCPMEMHGAVLA